MTPLEPLEPLEIAAGRALEPWRREPPRPPSRRGPTARAALEAAVLDALAAGRGSVSFSGGRDSSLILAVACHVARREGLPDPVAVTMRHGSAESQESAWQERVVRHVGVADWVRVDVADSMDVLGVEATSFLATAGLHAPANAYLHLPVVAVAPPGTVITGAGGDEILGTRGTHLARVAYARARPRRRDALSAGLASAPAVVRRGWARRSAVSGTPWLTPAAGRSVARRTAAERARVRLRWDVMATDHARSRSVQLGRRALDAVGASHGVRVVSPLLGDGFVDAFAREAGPAGPVSRTAAMTSLAHDLLPPDVLGRTTKAVFSTMVWGPRFRDFASTWQPEDLGPEVGDLVEPELLGRAWAHERPWFGSMLLAQRAWLGRRLPVSSP